jgi:hypothetical protein
MTAGGALFFSSIIWFAIARVIILLAQIARNTRRDHGSGKTFNPPTPKASAWQALTCHAVAGSEGGTLNAQRLKFGAIIYIIGALFACSLTPAPAQGQAVSKDTALSAVDGMVSAGLLRLDAPGGRAYVNPDVWAAFDAQAKEGLAAAVAFHISPNNPVAEIYDAQSGKKLARWGSGFGFTVY